LAHNFGFGAIHAAILTLATRLLSRERSFDVVLPQNEAEAQESRFPAPGELDPYLSAQGAENWYRQFGQVSL
jgi:hypothetical protein